jgi:hypothetical protein
MIVFLITGMIMLGSFDAQAQRAGRRSSAQARITKFRLHKPDNQYLGTLYATINGREKKIAEPVIDAWLIEGGRNLVYSMRDGAGGFEDEGESLRIYNARSGQSRKIMSEYYAVKDVTDVKTRGGKTALLVKMVDGGLGGYYFAVVDPLRGEVFFRGLARLLSRRGDIIRLGFYREDIDWTIFYQNENARGRPYKIESHNLTALLRRPVIVNKRDEP